MSNLQPMEFRFWCNEHGFVAAGFGEPITEVHFNQRGELGLACPLCFKSRPMTIEQWTGTWDTNEVKIFAGDIVKYEGYDNLAEVEWTDDLCQWSVTTRIYDGDEPEDFYLNAENIDPDKVIEVVGNIHQNEEMRI